MFKIFRKNCYGLDVHKLEPYSADGYLADQQTNRSMVISKSQALNLLRLRSYIIKDDFLSLAPV